MVIWVVKEIVCCGIVLGWVWEGEIETCGCAHCIVRVYDRYLWGCMALVVVGWCM